VIPHVFSESEQDIVETGSRTLTRNARVRGRHSYHSGQIDTVIASQLQMPEAPCHPRLKPHSPDANQMVAMTQSTGEWARRSPSDPCSWDGRTIGSPVRIHGVEPSVILMEFIVDSESGWQYKPSSSAIAGTPSSTSTTPCSVSRCDGLRSTATPWHGQMPW